MMMKGNSEETESSTTWTTAVRLSRKSRFSKTNWIHTSLWVIWIEVWRCRTSCNNSNNCLNKNNSSINNNFTCHFLHIRCNISSCNNMCISCIIITITSIIWENTPVTTSQLWSLFHLQLLLSIFRKACNITHLNTTSRPSNVWTADFTCKLFHISLYRFLYKEILFCF